MLSQSVKTKLRRLNQKKFRDEFGVFLVEGYKGVTEGLITSRLNLLVLSSDKSHLPEVEDLVQHAEKKGLGTIKKI
jgi:hypothetical protein